ncbi:hypothetical protein [Streptomyces sp. NPDC020597]|uniref:hypothetical protein n=1 Tax=unclassified Streptomyces TaxID=2593676 RepID=UPI0037AE794F
MTDVEWAEVRAAMPVPAWLLKRGGRPEAYCHREMPDAVRYLVDNGGRALVHACALGAGTIQGELQEQLTSALSASDIVIRDSLARFSNSGRATR